MQNLLSLSPDVSWSFAVVLAWVAGEFGSRWTSLPRISIYGLVGFILASTQFGFLPAAEQSNILLFANIALGLTLFEMGYRVNLRWLRTNPWIGITGLVESVVTFVVVYAISSWYGISNINALLLSSLAMSTSPAGVLRVINETRSSGQVTERILHLTAINCVLAVFAFKVIVGLAVFKTSGNFGNAVSSSMFVLVVSAILGAVFGVIIPNIMRSLGKLSQDGTLAFALSIILLVAITHAAKLSPVLATMTFGLVARHYRVALNQTQRNFGALGELLTVLLFVFVVSTLEWQKILAGSGLGVILIAARLATKTFGVAIFAKLSGITWRKGMLTGVALAPISAFVILVLEQARYLGISFIDQLEALAAMTLFMEVLGPVITQRALKLAKEVYNIKEE
ncbi:MAG: sodium/hydrogen exchanger family protein [Rickettsiaceae bacterium]|jgi:Kef-type K+ transport system membrane component KefB|nr:sodium/hydrogen exchanger family protein [Rickettsiaceae bacterium]